MFPLLAAFCFRRRISHIAVINAIRPIAPRATPTPIPVFTLVGSPIDVVEDVGELDSERPNGTIAAAVKGW
jgi:hypothetical protein